MQTLQLNKQDDRYLSLNRLVLTLTCVVFTLMFLTLWFFDQIKLYPFIYFNLLLWIVYLLLFFYLKAAYRHFRYAMNAHGLFIHHGVFWRRKIVVPRNRVQHTDVTQGPLERKYHLAKLVVHTAGTRNAIVNLPGISFKDAELLRESLSFEESDDV